MIYLFGANSMIGWSLFRARKDVVPFCNGYTKKPPPETPPLARICHGSARPTT